MKVMENYIKSLVEKRETSIDYKIDRIKNIYRNTKIHILSPGFYEVIESDDGGMRDIPQFTIEITNFINQKDLALRLYELRGYLSPWNRLEVREYLPKMDITI